ncbi:hypothetical protein FHG87_008152 [Trinorchestia longiramus]|nr:hypothetical protein FHG87_008152 [Trinorchestia longiramus]
MTPVHKLTAAYQLESVKEAAAAVERASGRVIGSITDNHKVNQQYCKLFERLVETLENICFDLIFDVILNVARNHDRPSPLKEDVVLFRRVEAWVQGMPVTIIDRIIPKMLNHIASRVARRDRMTGLLSVLRVLLQPRISKLDLATLFTMHRMSSISNDRIKRLVADRVSHMHHLTELHIPAKCTDAILEAVAASCSRLKVAKLRLSQVTDAGVEALVKGCPRLQVLELQDCTMVTSKGVLSVLEHCPQLQQLHANNLLAILITNFHGTDRKFPFRHLSQYSSSDGFPVAALQWLFQAVPQLNTLQICLRNTDLDALRYLSKTVHTLDLEVTEDYLEPPWSAIGPQLSSLAIKCNCLAAYQLLNIGHHCRDLQQFQLTTQAISDGHIVHNSAGELFKNLRNLFFQVYDEELHVRCFEAFLLHCRMLEVVWINSEMSFLTDSYLRKLLAAGSLSSVRRLNLTSDVPVQNRRNKPESQQGSDQDRKERSDQKKMFELFKEHLQKIRKSLQEKVD